MGAAAVAADLLSLTPVREEAPTDRRGGNRADPVGYPTLAPEGLSAVFTSAAADAGQCHAVVVCGKHTAWPVRCIEKCQTQKYLVTLKLEVVALSANTAATSVREVGIRV